MGKMLVRLHFHKQLGVVEHASDPRMCTKKDKRDKTGSRKKVKDPI
jgi:hypothetical protein